MSQFPKKRKQPSKAILLGMGLDADGHKRVTTGDNFVLLGGSEETHEGMVEKAIQINEKLAYKGKQLEEVSADEFDEIAHSVGLRRHPPAKTRKIVPSQIQPLSRHSPLSFTKKLKIRHSAPARSFH